MYLLIKTHTVAPHTAHMTGGTVNIIMSKAMDIIPSALLVVMNIVVTEDVAITNKILVWILMATIHIVQEVQILMGMTATILMDMTAKIPMGTTTTTILMGMNTILMGTTNMILIQALSYVGILTILRMKSDISSIKSMDLRVTATEMAPSIVATLIVVPILTIMALEAMRHDIETVTISSRQIYVEYLLNTLFNHYNN